MDSSSSKNHSAGLSEDKQLPAGVLQAGGILDRIVQAKVLRLHESESAAKGPSDSTPALSPGSRSAHAFASRLSLPGINIIAEIKQRSPSKGVIREKFDPLEIAASYVAHGAAALSVLTEEDFFGGSLQYLETIRQRHPEIPLLRKDFVFNEAQVKESYQAGADALLLIAAIVDDRLLARLIECTAKLDIDALVEVHTRSEMERVVAAHASVIGVNNRDLTDFTVTLDTSIGLAPIVPAGSAVLVAESGITSAADVVKLKRAGFNAFLIGEHFMRAPDPGAALRQLLADARSAQAVGVAGSEMAV